MSQGLAGRGWRWAFLDLTDTLLALIFSVKLRSFNIPIRSTDAECINVNYIPRNIPNVLLSGTLAGVSLSNLNQR